MGLRVRVPPEVFTLFKIMPDISLCANGDTCDLRFSCYRFLAFPSQAQSYIESPEPGEECIYYFPDRELYMKPFKDHD